MGDENVTHQLAAILHADVSGYSRLTEIDEVGTHRQLSTSLDLIADRVRNAGGEVVHYAGDAVLARFQSIVAATNCAIGIQNAIGTLGSELEADKRVLFRIGINLGEIIVDRNDIYGEGVNIAARLESLAEPGGICVSESVYREVQDKIDARFEDLGKQQLKNISRAVQVYRIGADSGSLIGNDQVPEGALRMSRYSRIVGPESKQEMHGIFLHAEAPSIMILPFKNLSGDEDQGALVDGFRLAIQAALAKLSGLFLINAPSTSGSMRVSTRWI